MSDLDNVESMLDFRQIRIFKAVFEAGSIVGAGHLERCAPSVVAHHLANLEHAIKQTLFERSPRGVIPTIAGHQLYPHAIAILRAVEAAEAEMQNQGESLSGRVAVGLAFSAVAGMAMPLLERLAQRQPDLKLELAESVSGTTIERLLAADIDLALAYNPPKDARLAVTPMLEEDLICVGKPDLVGNPHAPLEFEEFLQKRFVLPRKGIRGRPTPDSTEAQRRLEQHAALFSENVAAALAFVNSGAGVMLGTWANIKQGAFAADIIGRAIVNPELTRSLYLCERKDTPPSRTLTYVRALMIEIIEEEIASGRWICRPSRNDKQ